AQVPLTRAWTWLESIWAAPTAEGAILADDTAASAISPVVIPPDATAMVPVVVIGPPVSPAPVPTELTVPPLLAWHTTVPSWFTLRIELPVGQVPVTRPWTVVVSTS